MKNIATVLACALLSGHFSIAQETNESELFTNVYVVPPTFLSTEVERRPSALDILQSAGIAFPEEGSAIYNPTTSQLIVRNTQEQMELVETFIDSLIQKVEKQIYLTFREIEFDARSKIGTGFWELPEDLPYEDTTHRRQTFSERESFFDALSRPPREVPIEKHKLRRGIAGVFTDPQFQVVIRALGEKLGEKAIVTPPSVMARSGQSVLVQVENKRWGVVPVIGADEFTIDLALYFPSHGEAFFPDGPESRKPQQLTIWDGQTVAWAEENQEGRFRIVFVKAQLMDPAGMPINDPRGLPKDGEEARNAPEPETTFTPNSGKLVQAPEVVTPPELSGDQQNQVKEADELALRGSKLMADGETGAAIDHYTRALRILPEHEMTGPRRRAYEKQLARALSMHGRADENFHIVKKGESLVDIARRYDLSAEKIKQANKLKTDTILEGQLLAIPGANRKSQEQVRLEEALKEVVIPSYDVSEISLNQAVGLIQLALLYNLDCGLFPELTPRFVFEEVDDADEIKITLRLSNVPVAEALRYVTQLANCRYGVEGDRIIISPH